MNSLEAFITLYKLYAQKGMPCISTDEQELWDSIRDDLAVLDILKRTYDVCPDDNKPFRFSEYTSKSDGFHIDYLVIDSKSCFIIKPSEKELLTNWLERNKQNAHLNK